MLQRLVGGGGEGLGFPISLEGAGKKVLAQRNDISCALPQGRNGQRHDVQTVIEVHPEGAVLDAGGQVGIRGGDDTEVDVFPLQSADPLHLLGLQYAEQLALERQGHRVYLVQKKGPAVGNLDEAPLAGGVCAGKSPFLITEELGFQQMLRQDIQPLESVMQTLAEQIKACSFTAQAKGLFRRVFGGAAPLAEVQAAYEKAIPKINACADEMTDRRVALMRDSALLDRLYERNEGLYRELCSLIVVGDEAVAQARARGENPQNVARMERRVQDLRVTQVASTQLAAQIRAVQASDETTCSRLQAALEVTIPLWKSQMAAALGLARATDSLTMQRRVGEQAARDVRRGARELAEQTKAYAAADADSDRQRAQQTAESLLAELADIEQSLSEQEKIRRAEQSAERGV